MKKLKKYIVVSPILLCLLFSFCTPFIASAKTSFEFSITEPPVDNFHGYVVVPWYNPSYNIYQCSLYYWVITPVVKGDMAEAPVVTLDYKPLDNDFTLMFATGDMDASFTVAVYSVSGYPNGSTNSNGNTYCDGIFNISYNSSPQIGITFGSNIRFFNPIYQGVTFLDSESAPATLGNASIVWGDDVALFEEAEKINGLLNDILTCLDDHYWQNLEFFEYFNNYLQLIEKDTTGLVGLLNQLYDEWYAWTWVEEEYYIRIIELLEEAVEGEKPPNQDSMQDSYDDYADIEQDLINNEEASNAIGNFDVTIEGGAYSVIWNMITDFLNSNSKVFGLFIACLTLAFIALLLHR